MTFSFSDRKGTRLDFGRIRSVAPMPNLIEVQKSSYDQFLQMDAPPEKRTDTGLQGVLKAVFPIKDFSDRAELHFVSYEFEEPKYDVEECQQRGMTYAAPLKVTLQLWIFDIDEDINKRGKESYGTTTADGLLSLLAMRVPHDDPRVTTASDWLVAHHRLDRVAGFDEKRADGWGKAMVHYYRATSAQAFRVLGVDEAPAGHDWRADLAAALAAEQRADGSFLNTNILMKEDDPLIATTPAVRGLVAAR